MKLNKILIVLLAVAGLAITSCVKDDDYGIPESLGNEENEKLNEILNLIKNDDTWSLVSIADLKAKYASEGAPVLIEKNDVVKGYVTSSDESGNFYKEFYIQDKAENPTIGIKVSLNLVSSYNRFNVGREVYINLNGLYIGESNFGDGVIAIGGKIKTNDPREIDPVSENQMPKHIFRSSKTETIVPSSIAISQIGNNQVGTFVKIDNVYFNSSIAGQPYVDPNEDFDTQRKLEGCKDFDEGELLVETSSFANFGSSKIPVGGGYIEGVISKDYRGNNFVLVLNGLEDVTFTEEYECASGGSGDFTPKTVTELDETFDTAEKGEDLTLEGWYTEAVQGERKWQGKEFDNNKFMSVSGYKAISPNIESWVVTPGLNLEEATNKNFTFQSQRGFSKNETLEVFIASDFDYTKGVGAATWQKLSPTLAEKKSSGYTAFVDAGSLDLSSYSGVVYIAFKYNGNNSDATGTINIDNVKFNYAETGGGGGSGGTANKFDFENTATTLTSYTQTETLTAADGTELNYLARTNVGSYAIEGKGLMLKDAQHIKLIFSNGVKQLKFKYRGAFTNTDDRVIIVYEGDENSTTELERKEFPFDTALGEFVLDLNKTGTYTVTIKGGTTRQVVVDDVEWTDME